MPKIDKYLRSPFLILLILFLLSLLVRVPTLDRPLSKHHEYITALMLVNLECWQEKGLAYYKGVPVLMYEEPFTQKFYNLQNHPQADAQGNMYYTSHPPFAFYLPHFLLKILGLPVSALALQILNLLFHGISAVLIFFIIRNLLGKESEHVNRAGLVAAGVYLFMPSTLWFCSNTYFADTFSVNLLVLLLFFLSRLSVAENKPELKNILPIGLSVFLLAYTEWIGFIMAGVIAILFFIFYKNKYSSLVGLLTIIAAAIAGVFIVWQYSQINGMEGYLNTFKSRFLERSFAGGNSDNLGVELFKYIKKWRFIAWHYFTAFLPILLLMGAFILIGLKKEKAGSPLLPKKFKLFLLISILPVLFHHALLIRYSMFHDYSVLKAAPFLSILIGILFFRLPQSKTFITLFCLALTLCIGQYYYINRPGPISRNGDRYDEMKNMGLYIKEHSSKEEMIFLNGRKGSPQISYYAKRNLFYAPDTLEARRLMDLVGAEKGKLFEAGKTRIEKMITVQ